MMGVLRAEVAVIGAGPAGAAAATALAAAGVRVVLLDRSQFPRDKVCGDGLLPDAFSPLSRLGVLEEVRRKAQAVRGIHFRAPSGQRGLVPVDGMVIPRMILDAVLVSRARAAGAMLEEGLTLEQFEGTPGRWQAALFSRSGSSGWLRVEADGFVLATGAAPRPRRLALLPHAPRAGAAVRAYVPVADLASDELLIAFERQRLPRGYYWAFPLGNGAFNVGCGIFAGRAGAPSLLDEARNFATGLGASFWDRQARGAALQASFPHLAVAQGNLLAVGEAAGLTRPFSGEGIGPAMESGLAAAQVLSAGIGTAGRRYARWLKGRFAREFAAYRWGERLLGWPWLIDLLIRRVQTSATARTRVKAVLAAHLSPATILSIRGLTRLLLRR